MTNDETADLTATSEQVQAPVPMAEDWTDWVEEEEVVLVVTVDSALADLEARRDADRAEALARKHGTSLPVLGIAPAEVTALATAWRGALPLDERLVVADALWDSATHEGRLIAARLMIQARIREDAPVWERLTAWAPQADSEALGDVIADAAARRLVTDAERFEQIEAWAAAPLPELRRIAIMATGPYARMNYPKAHEIELRARCLTMLEALVNDRSKGVRTAVAAWLRDLARHDPGLTQDFLNGPGQAIKAYLRKQIGRRLEG